MYVVLINHKTAINRIEVLLFIIHMHLNKQFLKFYLNLDPIEIKRKFVITCKSVYNYRD